MQITEVAAALIWEKGYRKACEEKRKAGTYTGRFLICQRPAQEARGLLWEFAGGKVEDGETKEEALVRECREELGIIIRVGDVFMETVHEYPDLAIRLTLFHAEIAEGFPKLLEHHDLRWILPEEIPQYDFCPADEEILKELMRG